MADNLTRKSAHIRISTSKNRVILKMFFNRNRNINTSRAPTKSRGNQLIHKLLVANCKG